MLPRDLQAEQFAGYPPEAKRRDRSSFGRAAELPLSFLPSLLREVIEYDFKFPAERAAIDKELASLSSLSRVADQGLVSRFRALFSLLEA